MLVSLRARIARASISDDQCRRAKGFAMTVGSASKLTVTNIVIDSVFCCGCSTGQGLALGEVTLLALTGGTYRQLPVGGQYSKRYHNDYT